MVPNLTLNAWYLDDGILVGSPRDIAASLNIIESDGPSLGLKLNRTKSLLFITEDADASCSLLPPEIPITQRGFTLLGCLIGPPSFCEEVFLSRVSKVKTTLEFLQDIDDSQMDTALKSCLAFPKVVFPLRTCPPHYIHDALEEFDNTIRELLEAILARTVPAWSWLKASLPSSRGGVSLRSASLDARAAFLGSRMQAESLMEKILGHPSGPSPHTQLTLAALASATARPDWTSLDEVDVPLRQNPLSLAIDEATEQSLLSSAPDTHSRALALSSCLFNAGDWLNVVPLVSLGLHLHDQEFRSSLRYWLGVPLQSVSYQCCCLADIYGDHQVACGSNGDRIARHNSLRDMIFFATQAAALGPRREAPSIVPNSSSRPADILLPSRSQGRSAVLDVSVISPLQKMTLSGVATSPGHALNVWANRKLAASLPACRAASVEFIALIVETLGGWSSEAILNIKKIDQSLGQRTSPTFPAETVRHLFGRLAMAFWRGNTTLWLRG